MLDDSSPIFAQIAERLADEIADGTLPEGGRAPSSNELAAFYRINPATAAKGLNVLTEDGLLEKRRGVGMFVAAGARERLVERRRQAFAQRYVAPMVDEANRLGIDAEALLALVRQVSEGPPGAALDETEPRSARGGITV
ncbi:MULTISPECIES: GntR family transcriptional regulator [Pseudofrankia]|uniref:GntR family transcriptional regulator n=1 Tax=Pseudofrankia TaxID=2994363 RepID=UPI000234CCDA|nr:GntR family transcriptional regulator [Pseudofrankia sp. EUN1h]OHV34128.1 GntR family transcriptional regulator [Pseudofrankia sp. EUN1h]